MSYVRFVGACMLSASLFVPTLAFAQGSTAPSYPPCESKPTEGDTAAAKGAFQAGTAAYNEADYDRAATYWEDAFRRDCTATGLLLNLARAYESGNKLEHAIAALSTYNERNPDSPQRDQIQRRLERLQEQIDARAAAPTTQPTPTPTPTAKPQHNAPPPAAEEKKSGPSALPLVLAISGGTIALVSGGLYLKAANDTKKFEEQCPNRDCPDTTTENNANAARKRQQLFGGIALGGVAVGVAGAIWYYFEAKRAARNNAGELAPARTVRFVPAVGPDFAGVSVDGTFSF